MIRTLPAIGAGLALAGLTAACDDRPVAPGPAPVPPAAAEAPATVSIIRPSVRAEIENRQEPAPQPVEARVLFDYGSAELSDTARARLDGVLATEGLTGDGWTLTLTGHTDSRGGTRANQRMALERAEAVRTYLVGRGLAAEQIKVIAAGEVEPTPDQTGSDAAEARRVDLMAIPPPRT